MVGNTSLWKQQFRPLAMLTAMAFAATLLCMPVAWRMDHLDGVKLCAVAGGLCFLAGTAILILPCLFPVADTYVLVVSLGFWLRMFLPLIACMIVSAMVSLAAARTFAICLLLIYPVLLLSETTHWVKKISAHGCGEGLAASNQCSRRQHHTEETYD